MSLCHIPDIQFKVFVTYLTYSLEVDIQFVHLLTGHSQSTRKLRFSWYIINLETPYISKCWTFYREEGWVGGDGRVTAK